MKLTRADNGYPALRAAVEQTLFRGQKKIEEAKVQVYWRTGKIINDYIGRAKSKDEHYGYHVITRLSKDLKISPRVLGYCAKFAATFKILNARSKSPLPHLTWSHYRELSTVTDEQSRTSLMRRAEKSSWSYRELAEKIRREERPNDPEEKRSVPSARAFRLVPKKGVPYVYQLVASDSLHNQEDADTLWIDLGFRIHHQLPSQSKNLKPGMLIESKKSSTGNYSIHPSQKTESVLFTYKAFVERVVDGDTLIVKIDLGFGTRIREYIRLRGINAPEKDTPEGQRAKNFVTRQLKKTTHILLTSTRADKYGRYLADIFYGASQPQYLNQILLDQKLATPYVTH